MSAAFLHLYLPVDIKTKLCDIEKRIRIDSKGNDNDNDNDNGNGNGNKSDFVGNITRKIIVSCIIALQKS
ncbi:hypothetical protein MBAV_006421, partial [Candidatus Magnetobacterium bavaricum]